MNQPLKDRIKRTFIYPMMDKRTFIYPIWMDVSFRNWEKKGRPIPPPPAVKAEKIKDYARRFSIDILSESEHIPFHPIKGHVILIDDTREFTGRYVYQPIEYLIEFVSKERPADVFGIKVLGSTNSNV